MSKFNDSFEQELYKRKINRYNNLNVSKRFFYPEDFINWIDDDQDLKFSEYYTAVWNQNERVESVTFDSIGLIKSN